MKGNKPKQNNNMLLPFRTKGEASLHVLKNAINKKRRGFAIAPILYLLTLAGVAGGVLFSGYSQVIKSGIEVTNATSAKNEISRALNSLAGMSEVGDDPANAGADLNLFCPPGSTTRGCTEAPIAMELFDGLSEADKKKLPINFANAENSGVADEVGVLSTASGLKQLDPWGKFYILCRWEQLRTADAEPTIMLITAGANATLETECGDAVRQGDDQMVALTVQQATERATAWQEDGNDIEYGATGTKVVIGEDGSITAVNLNVSGTASFGSLDLTAPLPIISGGTGADNASGALTNFGAGAFGKTMFAQISDTNARIALGATAVGVNLFTAVDEAAGRAAIGGSPWGSTVFTAADAGSGRVALGATTVGHYLFSSSLYNDVAATAARQLLGSSAVGDNVFTAGSVSAAQDAIGAGAFGKSIFTAGTAGDALALLGGKTTGIALFGTVTVADAWAVLGLTGTPGSLDMDITGEAGSVDGANITGTVPIAHGGTSASTASGALDNFFAGDNSPGANYLNLARLNANSIDSSKMTSIVSSGTYNNVVVDTAGRVTSGSFVVYEQNKITDGLGNSIVASATNGGQLVFSTASAVHMVIDSIGNVGIGTEAPEEKLHIFGGHARISGPSDDFRELQFATSTSEKRWILAADDSTETGSGNTGSDFVIRRVLDDGTPLTSFTMDRATGNSAFSGSVAAGGGFLGYFTGTFDGTVIGGASSDLGGGPSTANPARGDDATTGLYSSAAATVQVAISGVESWKLNANGMDLPVGSYFLGGNKILHYPNGDMSSLGIGVSSLLNYTVTVGGGNLAVGTAALRDNTTGTHNTALGINTLTHNTTAGENVGVGAYALYSNTTGSQNTAVGRNAMRLTTTGLYNTALGKAALYNNLVSNNTAIGYYSLYSTTTGTSNTAIGKYAGFKNVNGSNNISLGYYVGSTTLTTGSSNILIGTSSAVDTPAADTSNYLNIGNAIKLDMTSVTATNPILHMPMLDNTSIALGLGALESQTATNLSNTAVGQNALSLLTTGFANTAFGKEALHHTTIGSKNNAYGTWALAKNTSGDRNDALGYSALYYNTTGSDNISLGYLSLYQNISGAGNIAIGGNALGHNLIGNENTSIGRDSLRFITGSKNTALGHAVGSITLATGSGNILIGTDNTVDTPTAATDNWLNIGNIIFGDMATNKVRIGGSGAITADATLDMSPATNSMILPQGLTGERPGSALEGMVRYNTTDNVLEVYQGATPDWEQMTLGASATAGSTMFLGASVTGASPSRSDDITTGLYSDVAGTVKTAISGVEVLAVTATGINLGAITHGYGIAGNIVLHQPMGDPTSIGVGEGSLIAQTATNQNNTAIGFHTLFSNTTGFDSVAVGREALSSQTTGSVNIAIGKGTLASLTIGEDNIGIGRYALNDNLLGNNNVAMGKSALFKNLANQNVAIGSYTLAETTTGSGNTAIGYAVGSTTLVTGSSNILIGTSSAVDTPTAVTSNWLNIGNTIYGDLSTGSIALGAAAVTAETTLDMSARTDSMIIPKGTTAEQPTGVEGMVRYNTTDNSLEIYQGSTPAWVQLTGEASNDLGTASNATSPFRTGEAGTGLFTPATNVVSVATNGLERLRVDANGAVKLGAGTVTTGAVLDLAAGTGALSSIIMPKDSTANRPSGIAGMLRYNTDDNSFEGYNGAEWVSFSASGAGLSGTVGEVTIWTTSGVPAGYLECTGQAVSRTVYSQLFDVLGTIYGVGDGSTTFNVPDYRGEFLRGWDHTAGNDPDAATRTDRGDGTTGDNVGTKQAYELQLHKHKATVYYGSTGSNQGMQNGNMTYQPAQSWDTTEVGGNETRPRNTNVMFIVRYQKDMGGGVASLDNPQNFSITGDATAPVISFDGTAPVALQATVTKVQGYAISTTAPTEGQALIWNTASAEWQPNTAGSDGFLGATATETAPSRSDDVTTGLFSATATTISIATGGVERVHVDADGNINIGAGAPTAGVNLDLSSKTDSLITPKGTIAQRPASGVEGMIRYNTDTNSFEGYQGSTPDWSALGAGSAVASGGQSMIAGWPDAIMCESASSKNFYIHWEASSTGAHTYMLSHATSNFSVTYNSDGSFNSNVNSTTKDCVTNTWSISYLIANGKAFNFVNGGGGVNEVPIGTAGAPGLYFTGDENTGLYRPAADTVAIATNGVEKFRINADGDVTIGSGDATADVSLDISSKTDSILLPKGLTAERPASGVEGMIRYNTVDNVIEVYQGSTPAWEQLSLAATATSGSATYLGAAVGATSPSRSDDVTTGLFSDVAGTVKTAISGTEIMSVTATGINITSATSGLSIAGVNMLHHVGSDATSIGIGPNSLQTMTGTGEYNYAMGGGALKTNAASGRTAGSYNNVMGYSALQTNTVSEDNAGSFNNVIGNYALQTNTASGYGAGSYNNAIGKSALQNNISKGGGAGSYNNAIGGHALYSNRGDTSSAGSYNNAIGRSALQNNITKGNSGSYNNAIGNTALAFNTVNGVQAGSYNNSIGNNALASNTASGAQAGSYNNVIGYYVLASNTASGHTAGSNNNAIGNYALYSNTGSGDYAGSYNNVMGYHALYKNEGAGNTVIGSYAMGSTTVTYTGSYNVALGYGVASTTLATGSNNILIGTSSAVDTPVAATSNWLNIGNTIYGDLATGSIAIGAAAITGGATLDMSARTDSMITPKGLTAERPASGVEGMIRYNTETNSFEGYQGSTPAWSALGAGSAVSGGQSFYMGFPDAIICTENNTETTYYHRHMDVAGNHQYTPYHNATYHSVSYNSSGSYITYTGALTDCTSNAWSVSDLIANGKAFNIVNGGGGVNEVPVGTAGAPGLYFTGDTNTGLYRPAADTVAIATNGVEKFRVNAAGDVTIGSGDATADVALDISSKTTSIILPKGTEAQRPSSGVEGMIRYNTETNSFEGYQGSTPDWSALGAGGVASGGQSLISGWPDALFCTSAGVEYLFVSRERTTASGLVGYMLSGSAAYLIYYNSDGTYSSHGGLSASWDCVANTSTISDLIANGKAFNFVNGGGGVNEVPVGTAGAPGLYFTGDENTGVYRPAADTVAIATNGVEKFRVDANGKVRIGAGAVTADVTLDMSSHTDSMIIPTGTEAQRPATGVAGMLRFNSEANEFEGYDGSAWGSIGGAGAAGASGQSLYEGWPDALVCEIITAAMGTRTFYARAMPALDGLYYYVTGGNEGIVYNANGTYYGPLGAIATVTDCSNKTIATLISEGKAFNFVNGGGGVNEMADGTAGAPGLYFTADMNTGIYRPAADTFAFAANGVEVLRVSATGVNLYDITQGYGIAGNTVLYQPVGDTTSIGVGMDTLTAQTATNLYNTAMGYQSLQVTTVGYNTGFGSQTLKSNLTGTNNIALGVGALRSNTVGSYNVAVGNWTLTETVTGNQNIAIGMSALTANTIGSYNVAGGSYALAGNTVGQNNTAHGNSSGRVLISGSNNSFYGFGVGSTTLTTGSNNILIGTSSAVDTPVAATSNWLNIGNTIYGDLATGSVAIGAAAITGGATLDMSARTDSMLLPKGLTGERPTGVEGMVRYNTTLERIEVYQGPAPSWVQLETTASEGDTEPDAFSFTNQTGAPPATTITSNGVVLANFDGIVSATCSNCTDILRNGKSNGNSANFEAGDTIALQVLSSASASSAVTATVTVGKMTSGTWSVTTGVNIPDVFTFTNQTGAAVSSTITSNAVTLAGGFSGAAATCGANCDTLSINGGAFVASATGVNSGDTIAIRLTTPASESVDTVATVTVGGRTSGDWTVTTGADPCAGTPAGGAVCADGSVFAGYSPDGNNKMYVARCDAGMSWNGSSCDGTRKGYSFAEGASWATGVRGANTGRANTAALAARNGEVDGPYPSTSYCTNLSENGRDDWYLPSTAEFSAMNGNMVAIGGFHMTYGYHTSRELSTTLQYIFWVPDGSLITNYNKVNAGYFVRCARREGGDTPAVDPCDGSPAVGAQCNDGTVYAGISPDGSNKMYATHCDVGMTWTGAVCTGYRSLTQFSSGNTIETGIQDADKGMANTQALVALNGNADGPYQVASTCDSLTEGGHSDWYAPALNEFSVLYTNRVAIGNFLTAAGGYYRSSTEQDYYAGRTVFAETGGLSQLSKVATVASYLRCVRREGSLTPLTDPCDGSPAVGTVCMDGSVYAGISPDGDQKMYVPRCEYNKAWVGGTCAGTRLTQTYASANTVLTSAISTTSGLSNTNTLVSLNGGPAGPYNSATICHSMTAHGHDDWYLPATGEWDILIAGKTAIGSATIGTTGNYWSSTDSTMSGAYKIDSADGSHDYVTKALASIVLCARREGGSTIGLSTLYLGDSAATTNPSRSDDITTGLFSATATTVSIATGGVERLHVDAAGNITIGAGAPTAGVNLDLSSKTDSLITPKGTEAQRPASGVEGMIRYNTETNSFEGYQGSTPEWSALGAGGSGASGGQSMYSGWPDAITCNTISPAYGQMVFHAARMPAANGLYYYYNSILGGHYYNGSGAFDSYFNITTTDCNVSMATLIANGQAFNLTNGGGGVNEVPVGTAGAPGLYFTGDENTGVYRPAADTVAWATAGTEKMRLSAAGNLGFGATDPTTGTVIDTSSHTTSILLPKGTTAQQPTGVEGMIRYNTETNSFEGYQGSSPAWSELGAGSAAASGGQSLYSGWPDVIVCNVTSPWTHPNTIFHIGHQISGQYRYVSHNSGYIEFNSDGTYSGVVYNATSDCTGNSWTIAYLVANGKAFNLTNGGGGVNEVPIGTAGAPGLYFTGDLNTGVYRPAADTVAIATGGVEKFRVNAAGDVTIGSGDATAGVALDVSSKTTSILLPKGTEAQRPASGVEGMIRYNTETNSFEGYQGSTPDWSALGAGGVASGGQSFVSGWPDVIVCNKGIGDVYLYISFSNIASSVIYRRLVASVASDQYIAYNSAGEYSSNGNLGAYDCVTNARSISWLVINGSAFNIVNGGGGVNEMADGTAGAPGLYFTSDTNTGIYHPEADTFAFAANGVEVLRVSATGVNLYNITQGYGIAGNTVLHQPASDTTSIALGVDALVSQTATNLYNTAVGVNALGSTTTGNSNTALGTGALYYNTTGQRNVAIGRGALHYSQLAETSVAIGWSALINSQASYNVAVGGMALGHTVTGDWNTAIGTHAGEYNTTGTRNVALGTFAGRKNTTGSYNVSIGYNVGSTTLATGSNNILIGTSSAVDTPVAATSNWLNIGNTIYGDLATGSVAIGAAAITGGATLDMSARTDSMLLPKGLTGERPTGVEGMVRYNTTLERIEVYQGPAPSWVQLETTASEGDTEPDAFSFTNQTGAPPATTITSNGVVLANFDGIVSATCSNCTDILRNGKSNGNSANFEAGDTIALQVLSSASASSAVTATVTVGKMTSGTWSVTTGVNIPDVFTFTNQTGAAVSSTITSNAVTLAGGFSGAAATCGANCDTLSINGGAFVASATGVNSGDTIAIRLTTPASESVDTVATVTVGGRTSGDWTVTTGADVCAGMPAVGDVCADGSLFAGYSPDGNNKMFATRCDAGQTWGGSSCDGGRTQHKFSTGVTVEVPVENPNTGRSNTTALVALNGNADGPYDAATTCDSLVENSKSDWYLPAIGELDVIYSGRVAMANFLDNYYWSSVGSTTTKAVSLNMAANTHVDIGKTGPTFVRCVRREGGDTPAVDPCDGSPAVGAQCNDGTVYAGISPDGSNKMYAAHCDVGMTWTGGACIGTHLKKNYSTGVTIETGIQDVDKGMANTQALVALNASTDGPYIAATSCDSLTEGGHSDWYMPALNELSVLYAGKDAIGNFTTADGGYYRSSTEQDYLYNRTIGVVTGAEAQLVKITPNYGFVRCVRREGSLTPLTDSCDGSPAVGTVCMDGTVYAGISPDGDQKMYVPRCEYNKAWVGGTCAGTRLNQTFATANTVLSPAVSTTSGLSNTNTLVSLNGNSAGPYNAATVCHSLTIHGHDDWYLPATGEWDILVAGKNAIGSTPLGATNFWSSTDDNVGGANLIDISDGSHDVVTKLGGYVVVCARREGGSTIGLSTLYLGDSAATTNPSRSDDVTTGLFSATATTVSIATGGVERVHVDADGNINIGAGAPTVGVNFDLSSKTDSLITPKGTEAQRPASGVEGMIRYNTETNSFEGYQGSTPAWAALGGSSAASGGQSMLAGWPDAIVCNEPTWGATVFFKVYSPYAPTGLHMYRMISSGADYGIKFNADGSFNSYETLGATDCNVSIATLIANGQAFNLTNGGGGVNEVPVGTAGAPGLYFTGDENTGVYRPAADTVAWATAGTEKMRLSAAGNLGFGATDPTTGTVIDTSSHTTSILLPKGTTAQQPTGVEGMIRYNTETNAFEGYQGSSPAWSELGAGSGEAGTSGVTWVMIDSVDVTTAKTSHTFSGLNGDNDGEYKIVARFVSGNGASNYYLRPNNDASAVYGYQNVWGSSTTVVADRDVAYTGLRLGYAGATGNIATSNAYMYAKSGHTRTALVFIGRDIVGTTNKYVMSLSQSWNNTADNITSLVVDATAANGLGVGTHIELWAKRSIGGSGSATLGTSATANSPHAANDETTGLFSATADTVSIATAGVERVRVDANGKLGLNLGGANAAYPIEVGTTSADGNGAYLTAAGVWTSISDARVKENVRPLAYDINDLMKLKPVSYDMIGSGVKQIGMIAQDVMKVIPEVVSGSEETRYGLSYDNLLALAVKSIQDLKHAQDAQEERMMALIEENQSLKDRLEAVQADRVTSSVLGGEDKTHDLLMTVIKVGSVLGGLLVIGLGGLGYVLYRTRRKVVG